jgi:hypothetical protein
MVPLIGTPDAASTKGERRIATILEELFRGDPNTIARYEPALGDHRPDFIVVGLHYGILLIEVKDYLPQHLAEISKTNAWCLMEESEKVAAANPFDQLYKYTRKVLDAIRFSSLPQNMSAPVNQIAAFPHIPRDSPQGKEIQTICPSMVKVAFAEDIRTNEKFATFLADHCEIAQNLSRAKLNLLQYNLFPIARLPSSKQIGLTEYLSDEEKVRLLDLEQERLARELGEGHRLFFGVAGSGKTVLLVARARYLAKMHPRWRILVLCYNRNLAEFLYHLILPQEFPDITVANFHKWAARLIDTVGNEFQLAYRMARENARKEDKNDTFYSEVVPALLNDLFDKHPQMKYDAILIDEAQDFQPDWLRVIVKALNQETTSLLVACDGLQGIYARNKFRWSDVGIVARGRVRKFTKSYRNPKEIGKFATQVIPESLNERLGKEEEFLKTEAFADIEGRVELEIFNSRDDEYQWVLQKILPNLNTQKQILLIHKQNLTKNNLAHPLLNKLADSNVRWLKLADWTTEKGGLFIGTPQGTKGLEAEVVIIPELDAYRNDDERQLLYVAMTRSMQRLLLSAEKRTSLVDNLEHLTKNSY